MSAHKVKSDINLADDKVVDFKALGIKADVIAESTMGSGTTFSDNVGFHGSTPVAQGSAPTTINATGIDDDTYTAAE